MLVSRAFDVIICFKVCLQSLCFSIQTLWLVEIKQLTFLNTSCGVSNEGYDTIVNTEASIGADLLDDCFSIDIRSLGSCDTYARMSFALLLRRHDIEQRCS